MFKKQISWRVIYLKKKISLILFASMLVGTSAYAQTEKISYSREMPAFHASVSDPAQSIKNAAFFNACTQLAKGLRMIKSVHRIAYNEILLYNKEELINDVEQQLNLAKTSRSDLSENMRTLKVMNDPAATKVLSLHLKAINNYITANTYLKKYYNSPTQFNFNSFVKYDDQAYNLSVEIAELSQERYAYYMKKALNSLQ